MLHQRKQITLDTFPAPAHSASKLELIAWQSHSINSDTTVYSVVYHFSPEPLIYDFTNLHEALNNFQNSKDDLTK